ncbi:glycoside hydrolase family 32 protein [Prolixibacteraceae bacterium JC049]|nr:glycoside hydrolase family 32 protein [Prolixibacteraceae bacterium JC049]
MSSKFTLLALGLIFSVSVWAKSDQKNNEKHRPQYHFTVEKNWINNPCGLFFKDNTYHLYFQHNPTDKKWSNIHWGHATSKDLIHWENLPIAMKPMPSDGEEKKGSQWSGSVVVDHQNKFTKNGLLAFNYVVGYGVCLSTSSDNGTTWKIHDQNPVFNAPKEESIHDPKVFWHKPTQKWVMLIYRVPEANINLKGFSIYTSSNLTDWNFESHIPGFFESPDLFELPIDKRETQKIWVLSSANGDYMLGDFNGSKFKPRTAILKSDNGKYFYAPATWNTTIDGTEKRIQIAWMRNGEYPDMPFAGQLTFPCELELKTTSEGVRLVRTPIEQISTLADKTYEWEDKLLYPGVNKNIIKKVNADCFRLKAVFDLKNCNNFGFIFMKGKESNGVEILYTVKNNELTCLGQSMKVIPINNKVSIDILVDRTSLEIFANDGVDNMSICYTSKAEKPKHHLVTIGGELNVDYMEVTTLKSIYREKKK